MVDYAKSRATAERLIEKFGGSAFLVVQTPGPGGTILNPADPVPVEHPVHAAVISYTVEERAKSSIEVGVRRAVISAPEGTPEPGENDLLRFKDGEGGETDYRLKLDEALQPGGPNDVIIFFDCQARG